MASRIHSDIFIIENLYNQAMEDKQQTFESVKERIEVVLSNPAFRDFPQSQKDKMQAYLVLCSMQIRDCSLSELQKRLEDIARLNLSPSLIEKIDRAINLLQDQDKSLLQKQNELKLLKATNLALIEEAIKILNHSGILIQELTKRTIIITNLSKIVHENRENKAGLELAVKEFNLRNDELTFKITLLNTFISEIFQNNKKIDQLQKEIDPHGSITIRNLKVQDCAKFLEYYSFLKNNSVPQNNSQTVTLRIQPRNHL